MRLPREILVLLILLFVMIAGVSWYVVDRRAKNRAETTPATVQPARP